MAKELEEILTQLLLSAAQMTETTARTAKTVMTIANGVQFLGMRMATLEKRLSNVERSVIRN